MNIVTLIMVFFSILGAVDYILDNRFGIGREWERGFHLLGSMSLTMIGMIVLAPCIEHALAPVLSIIAEKTAFEPSIIAGSLLANDMGGATLSLALAQNDRIGYFNGLVVASMMGCTLSFTLPFALGVVDKKQHRLLLIGLLCGIVTIPIGCIVAGLLLGISLVTLTFDLIPLILLAAILVFGLLKSPEKCVRIFNALGIAVKIIITIGLVVGMITFLTGYEVIPYAAPIEEGALVILNAALVLSGTFPLVSMVSRLLRKPLQTFGNKIGINSTSAMGLVASLASSATSFGLMKHMDDRGTVLNSAFAVSGAFVFGSHLAYTLSVQGDYLLSVVVGKLVAGICAVIVAYVTYPKLNKKENEKAT